MSPEQVSILGVVDSNGGLTLDRPVPLPAGPVEVSIQAHSSAQPVVSSDVFWSTMEEIWAGQRARGYLPRSREEIDSSIADLRDDAETEMQSIEVIHLLGREPNSSPETGLQRQS